MTLLETINKFEKLDVLESPCMEGCKYALRLGAKIFMGPAMFALFTKERDDADSFKRLIRNVEVKEYKIGSNKSLLTHQSYWRE